MFLNRYRLLVAQKCRKWRKRGRAMLSEHGARENEDRRRYDGGRGMRTDGTHITPAPTTAASPIRPNSEAQTCLA